FHTWDGIRIASSTGTNSVMFSPATIWYLRQSLGSQMVPGSAQLSLNPTVMVFRYWSSDGFTMNDRSRSSWMSKPLASASESRSEERRVGKFYRTGETTYSNVRHQS